MARGVSDPRPAAGAEVAIHDEIGAEGVSAKGFLAELGAIPEAVPILVRITPQCRFRRPRRRPDPGGCADPCADHQPQRIGL